MTEKECYSCVYYQWEILERYYDEWCSKSEEYFMAKDNCPNYKGE